VLRGVIRAIRDGQDIAIVYQSMSRIEPGRRWIGPRALVHDGRRWHTRVWSPDRNEYRDFVLARILAIEEDRLAEPRPAVDSAWEEIVEVVLVPHPGLTAAQKRAVARDFGMVRLRAIVRIRRALLHYFLRQYGLRREGAKLKAEENQVIVQNADAIWPAGAPHPELPF